MDQARLDNLHSWFDGYVRSFYDIDPDGLRNIQMKVEHTGKVCEAMQELADGERLSPAEARIASAVALMHDVGRFPQYRRWRTFRDSDSDNHARLSVEVMREHNLLDVLPDSERLLIEEAVRFHNLLEIPTRLKSPTALFLRLIRDADKLDIWRVFLEHFQQPASEQASAVNLGFSDLPPASPECVAALAAGTVVHLDMVSSLNDLKLLQISWVYDLNFCTSYRLLQERGYIPALAAMLPDSEEVRVAVTKALYFIGKRSESASA